MLIGIALVAAVATWSCAGDGGAARPNIVLIIIDTLRADAVGIYGRTEPTSPELDALARGGVMFRRPVAQSSWTRPSIGSMLTSLYPRSIGIYKEPLQVLGPRFETLAEILKRYGYTTVGATANPNINTVFQFDQGFDHYADSNALWHWMAGKGDKRVVSSLNPLPTAPEMFDGITDWIGANGSSPFYVQITLMEVHEARKIQERVDRTLFAGTPNAPYLQALHYTSGEIGRFVEALSKRPGWDNTLFVITSDHGEGLTDHPDVPMSSGHGWLLYESQLLVPLILHGPATGLPAGRVIDRPVRLLDLAPTILDLARIPLPDHLQGVSLVPLIRGDDDADTPPERFFVETEIRHAEKIGVYTTEWKYFENRDGHEGN